MDPSSKVTPASVYINPKFKSAHINPNFLPKNPLHTATSTNIYINPKFKNAHINPNFLKKTQPSTMVSSSFEMTEDRSNEPKAKILTKTKTKLVREQSVTHQKLCETKSTYGINKKELPLISLGKRKLVRASLHQDVPIKQPTVVKQKSSSLQLAKKPLKTKYKIVKGSPSNLYKIDRRRKIESTLKYIPHSHSMLSPTRMIITDRKLLRIGTPNRKFATKFKQYKTLAMSNKKLDYLNINGVLYKSTRTKLQKQVTTSIAKSPNISPLQRTKTLFVRGEKFILNASGNCLTRVQTVNKSQLNPLLRRIDIGGLTYVAKSDDTYERTDRHKTQVHLTSAKHRSINLLSRNLVKSNVVCAIFRKLGKCKGFERGRCTRVHDVRHVAICPNFLKGLCRLDDCLLSHNISLAKMPTCRFFLMGMCAKTDCPYLHKKVNEKVEICSDFLNGYCEKADKCHRRHDFKNDVKKSAHDRKKIKLNVIDDTESVNELLESAKESKTQESNTRYFSDYQENEKSVDTSDSNKEKLSRILTKIDKVKANLNLCSGKTEDASCNSTQTSQTNTTIDATADQETLSLAESKRKRPKLGTLPSFIPLG